MRHSIPGMQRHASLRREASRSARRSTQRSSTKEPNNADITTLEEIPANLKNQLKDLLDKQEEIKIAVSTDLHFNGAYGNDWVLATEKRLIIYSSNGEPAADIQEIAFDKVASIEVQELHGNDILKVRTDDKLLEVARYSKGYAPKFAEAMPEIEALIEATKPAGEATEASRRRRDRSHDKRKNRCETCGRPIPRWTEVCPNCIEQGKLIVRLLKYALPYWRISAVALATMVVVRAVSVYPGILSKDLINDVLVPAGSTIQKGQAVHPAAFSQLVTIILLMVGVNVFTTIFSAVRGYMMAWVGQRVTLNLRNESYQHLTTLSIDFYQERDTGNLMSRITHDVQRLQDFIAEGLQDIIGDTLTLIYMFGVMFYFNWQLTLWAMIPMPLLIFFTYYYSAKMNKVFHTVWRRIAGISSILASTIPGVQVVKAFAREDYEVERFGKQSERVFESEMNAAKLWIFYGPTMGFIVFFGTIIIWFVGSRQILNGESNLGQLTMFMIYMTMFFRPVHTLCNMNRRFLMAATSAERVFEILDTPPKIADSEDALDVPHVRGEVEFRDVAFSYDGERNALNGVSFSVTAGEMIGLVGHSGSGKTTLINLVTRFYDTDEGEILIDGHDIRHITLGSLRDQISVVLQEPFLFDGTIADNIGYSKLGATQKEIIAAAKAANAHDFIIKFPDGYDTLVGERGTRVSGGERQRISIARAILKNPRILILDEATSSVDTETESKIQEALGRLIMGRTVFAIAHRLSTLKHADRLVVLKEGEIDEIGTHAELIEKNGTYANLCTKQTELSKIRAW